MRLHIHKHVFQLFFSGNAVQSYWRRSGLTVFRSLRDNSWKLETSFSSRRSIICLSRIIDLLATGKSRYFAQRRPIMVKYYQQFREESSSTKKSGFLDVNYKEYYWLIEMTKVPIFDFLYQSAQSSAFYVYAVVHFYPRSKCYFLLFQTHYHTLPYPQTKENKI